jgi:hypothetical protein
MEHQLNPGGHTPALQTEHRSTSGSSQRSVRPLSLAVSPSSSTEVALPGGVGGGGDGGGGGGDGPSGPSREALPKESSNRHSGTRSGTGRAPPLCSANTLLISRSRFSAAWTSSAVQVCPSLISSSTMAMINCKCCILVMPPVGWLSGDVGSSPAGCGKASGGGAGGGGDGGGGASGLPAKKVMNRSGGPSTCMSAMA